MLIRHQPYLIKIPVTPDKSYSDLRKLANAKILYRLEHPSPVKQGRPRKYQYENNDKQPFVIKKHSGQKN